MSACFDPRSCLVLLQNGLALLGALLNRGSVYDENKQIFWFEKNSVKSQVTGIRISLCKMDTEESLTKTPKLFKCDHCDCVFDSVSHKMCHQIKSHTTKKNGFSCPHCEQFSNESRFAVMAHIKRSHFPT